MTGIREAQTVWEGPVVASDAEAERVGLQQILLKYCGGVGAMSLG